MVYHNKFAFQPSLCCWIRWFSAAANWPIQIATPPVSHHHPPGGWCDTICYLLYVFVIASFFCTQMYAVYFSAFSCNTESSCSIFLCIFLCLTSDLMPRPSSHFVSANALSVRYKPLLKPYVLRARSIQQIKLCALIMCSLSNSIYVCMCHIYHIYISYVYMYTYILYVYMYALLHSLNTTSVSLGGRH